MRGADVHSTRCWRVDPLRLIVVSIVAFCCPGLAAGESARTDVEVSAQRVELDRDRGEALFVGEVVLRHGGLELRCERLRARVNDEGGLIAMEASGAVQVVARGLRATAGSARYDPVAGRVTLSGDPSVRRGASELRGRSILVDIHTGRVTIEEAHGVFRVGS